MPISNLFKPKWQHSDPAVRIAEIDRVDDQEILEKIACSDNNADVRKAAVARMTNQRALFSHASFDKETDVRIAALDHITDPGYINRLARTAFQGNTTVQIAAIEKTADDGVLGEIIENEEDPSVLKVAEKRRQSLTDTENRLLKSAEMMAVLDMKVPIIDDEAMFSRIVQGRNIPVGLSLSLDEFGDIYGSLLNSVPNPGGGGFNPFFVSAADGPCRLFCAGCSKLYPGSFIFGLSAADAFRGGVAIGGNVEAGKARTCPDCGEKQVVIVYQPVARD